MSPAARRITSPGTKSRIGTSCRWPSWALGPGSKLADGWPARSLARSPARTGRLTVAVLSTRSRRAATARLERYSCEKRRITLKITIVRMIRADSASPLTRERAARAPNSTTSGLLPLASNCAGQLGVPCLGISLAPQRRLRRSASCSLRPAAPLSSWANSSSRGLVPIAAMAASAWGPSLVCGAGLRRSWPPCEGQRGRVNRRARRAGTLILSRQSRARPIPIPPLER